MTTELWMLVASAGLQWALIMVAATPPLLRNGIAWAVGNRETTPDSPAWEVRAKKASANLQENLCIFAILVLAVSASGRTSDTTALGAQVFFGARCAHGLIYIAGITWLRTGVWLVSLAGMAMVASAFV